MGLCCWLAFLWLQGSTHQTLHEFQEALEYEMQAGTITQPTTSTEAIGNSCNSRACAHLAEPSHHLQMVTLSTLLKASVSVSMELIEHGTLSITPDVSLSKINKPLRCLIDPQFSTAIKSWKRPQEQRQGHPSSRVNSIVALCIKLLACWSALTPPRILEQTWHNQRAAVH